MAQQFQYSTNTGQQKTFEAADSTAALAALSGFSDAAKNSGVIAVRPPVTPAVQPNGTIPATDLSRSSSIEMPQPTAGAAAANMQAGLTAQVAGAEKTLTDTLTRERDAALKRQEELNKRLETMMQETDPTKRATYAQEERIIQNQLRAAETASASLEEDFTKRRSVVSELERLLTESNQLMATAKNQPVAMSVLNKSVSRTLQDVQARAGVLQAVVAGLDGNMGQARTLISDASGAVAASWNDRLAYYESYMNLVNKGALAKNKIHDDFAKAEIAMAEKKLSDLEATKNYLQELMINPESAQFLADAGVTLNDSVEEINAKMAERSREIEIQEVVNDLKMEGYTYVPFAGDRTDVVTLEVGGKTLAFVPPANVLSEWAGKDSELLSVDEAAKLGVPYGTTRAEAFGQTTGGGFDLDQENKLRTEFNGLSVAKSYQDVNASYDRVRSSYAEAQAAGANNQSRAAADQALIISFNKMLDPGSVVREGEYARSEQGQSVINQLLGKAQAALRGGAALTDADRNAIVSMTGRLYADYVNNYNQNVLRYRDLAKQTGARADNVAQFADTAGLIDPRTAKDGTIFILEGRAYQKQGNQVVELEESEESMGPVSSAVGNPQGKNRPQRNNNPLNIKASSVTRAYPGVAGVEGKSAADGGNFLIFESPEAGFAAAERLLKAPSYANLTVDAAMKRWSNNGYGGSVYPQVANKMVSSLTPTELRNLIEKMAQREGFYA